MKAGVINKKGREEILVHRTGTSYVTSLCNKSALCVSVALILFFMGMKSLGFGEILWLRYFNFLFLTGGILSALLLYKRRYGAEDIDYFTGLKIGLHISALAVTPFAVFMGVYLVFDISFMEFVKHNAEFGRFLTPGLCAGSLFVEGVSSGAVFTFMAMQYFKRE